jgi:Mce-associated membrane protein
VTVALDGAVDDLDAVAGEPPWSRGEPVAGWWARAGAFAIDVIAGVGVLAAALLVGWSAPEGGWLRWAGMIAAGLIFLAVVGNRVLLPGLTGWSLGRAVFGIEVLDRDGEQPTPVRLLLRDLAHLADTLPLFLGWLWPLIDRRGRTFADMLVGTEVLPADTDRPDWRRLAARVLAGLAATAVLVAALGYALVYRHQRAVDLTREEIATAGPKIVVDMLSYTAKSMTDDFAKAQSLVTESYRPELIKQQEAVRKAPVDNDYWVSNSSVLSASADRATVLMLLQGQRGTQPNQRFVTASVRADFEKAGPQDWKLSNLTVLSAPRSEAPPPPAPKPNGQPAPTPAAPPKQGGR